MQLARTMQAGRRRRSILLSGAIVLSAALLTAVACAIASAQASLEDGILSLLGATDARVVHPAGARLPQSILIDVRRWPEIRAATGRLAASLTVEPRAGAAHGTPTVATCLGVDFTDEAPFRAVRLRDGDPPSGAGDVLLDSVTAAAWDLQPGAPLRLSGPGGVRDVRVSGVFEQQRLGPFATTRLHVDRGLVQELASLPGELSTIALVVADGTDVDAFCALATARLPDPLVLEPADRVRTGFDRRVRSSRVGLAVATTMVFLACSLIVVTGMTTGVSERQRELAILRAIGATRGQLIGAQLIVGASHGAVGAVIGIPLGIALAAALAGRFSEFVPMGLVIHRTGVALAAAGAIGSGILGALWPAFAAAGIAPASAMRPYAMRPSARRLLAATLIALLLMLLPLPTRLFAGADQRFWSWVIVGLPGLFIGAFLAGVPVSLLVARFGAPPLARLLRLPPDLLTAALRLHPWRSGFTAGALMIGLALLVHTWSAGLAARADWLDRIQYADGFAFSPTGIPEPVVRAIDALPAVRSTTAITRLPVRIVGQQVFGLRGLSPPDTVCIGVDAETFFRMNAIEWIEGDPRTVIPRLARGEGVLVADRFLSARSIGAGDRITLGLDRVEHDFEILGVVSSAGLELVTQLFGLGGRTGDFAISCVFLDAAAVSDRFAVRDRQLLLLGLDPEVSDGTMEADLRRVAPGVIFQSGRAITDRVREIAAASMAVRSVIAIGAMLLASMAMASIVVAGVESRRWELGIMRAVGADRPVVTRLVLGETALLSLTGCLLGTGLGAAMAWMDTFQIRDLLGVELRFMLPLRPIAAGWVILFLMTTLLVRPAARRLRQRPVAELLAGRTG